MAEIIEENIPLREEYVRLLREQDRQPTDEREARIEQLQEQMRTNMRTHLHTLQERKEVTAKAAPKPKHNSKQVYDELLDIYRQALQLMIECRDIKKAMRQRQKIPQGGKRK